MKKIIILCVVVWLTGCASKKNSTFARAGDKLEPSTCTKCKGEPFYVNGRWINNAKK